MFIFALVILTRVVPLSIAQATTTRLTYFTFKFFWQTSFFSFFSFFFSTSSKYEATLAFFVLCFLGDLMNIQSPFTVALYLSPQTP